MPIQVPVVQTGLEQSIQQAAAKAGKNLRINMGPGAKSIESLSKPLGRLTGKADEFTKSMEAANARVLAFGASVGVIAAVSKGLQELVKTTIEVEKSLANINSILRQTESQLDSFKNQIFDIARNTGQTFDTVAEAALELSRQGLKAEEVTKRLNDALVLSRLSGLSAADSVAGLTAAVNSFSSAGLTTTEVLNKISAAAASAAVSDRDLIEGLKRSGAVAVASGVQFDELIGIISALQERTARGGAVIGNSLKTIFTRIQDIEKLKTLQNLGVQVTDLEGKVLSSNKVIENLAPTFAKLDQAAKVNLADNLVGKFQIAPFLALLEDYNLKVSRSGEVAATSFNATNEAYQRNEALSKTLADAVNVATVNLKELANTLGEIGVTDSLKNIIGVFNSIVSSITDVLDGDGIGSQFAKGLVKGISAVISGPGLALALVAIGKLLLDFAKFGAGALKTFFGLNKAAEAQKNLQGQIAASLLNDKGIRSAILSIEKQNISEGEKKKLQTQFFTKALNEQLMVMQKMQGIARTIAPGVMAGTASRRGKRAAGGFLPIGAESSDISRGVGGAPASAKPVVIPNFAFGGGKRGTMVANDSEYIVPNYANGGDAIFNQNMASSIGLPANARRVRAASGYIPNFATVSDLLKRPENFIKPDGSFTSNSARDAYNKSTGENRKKIDAYRNRNKGKRSYMANQQPNKSIMLIPQPNEFGMNLSDHKFVNPYKSARNGLIDFFEGPAVGISKKLKKGTSAGNKFSKLLTLDEDIQKAIATGVNTVFSDFKDASGNPNVFKTEPNQITASNVKKIMEKGGPGALGAIKGATFEALMQAIVGGVAQKGGELDVDFSRDKGDILDLIFGIEGKNFKFGDFKSSLDSKDKFARQVIDNVKGKVVLGKKSKTVNSKTAASGYIPNFAEGALEEAIGRERAAGLPVSQIRINQSGKLRNAQNPMGLAVTNTRDEPTGAIPNFVAGQTDSQKPAKDLTGIFFAVTAGMTALEGATAGAEGAMGKFTNSLSGALQTATGFAFAGSGISQAFQGATSKLGKFASKLGPVGIAVGGAIGAFQLGKDIFDELSGKNARIAKESDNVSKSLAALADVSEKVSVSFNKLSKVEQFNLEKEAESILGRKGFDLGKGGNVRMESSGSAGPGAAPNMRAVALTARDAAQNPEAFGKVTFTNEKGEEVTEVRIKTERTFVGNEEKQKLLEQSFKSVMSNLLAMNVSAASVDAKLDRFGKTLEADEFEELIDAAAELSDAQKKQRDQITKAFSGKSSEQLIKERSDKAKEIRSRKSGLGDAEISRREELELYDLAIKKAQELEKAEAQRSRELDAQIKKEIRDLQSKVRLDKFFFDERKRNFQSSLKFLLKENEITNDLKLTAIERSKQLKILNLEKKKEQDIVQGIESESRKLAKSLSEVESKSLFAANVKPEEVQKEIEGITIRLAEFATTADKAKFDDLIKALNADGLDSKAIKDILENASVGVDNLGENVQLALPGILSFLEALRSLGFITDQNFKQGKKKVGIETGGENKDLSNKFSIFRDDQNLAGRRARRISDINRQSDEEVAIQRERAELSQPVLFSGRIDSVMRQARTDVLANRQEVIDLERRKKLLDDQRLVRSKDFLLSEATARGESQAELSRLKELKDLDKIRNEISKENLSILDDQLSSMQNETDELNLQLELAKEKKTQTQIEADLIRDKGLFGAGFATGFNKIVENADDSANTLGETLGSASAQFAYNIGNAMLDAIQKGENLGDVLLGTAAEFLNLISRAFMKSAVDDILGSFGVGKQGGGPISGGSGTKDDVPAMLMGGEFVMNKKAVRKYGMGFMSALNNGSLQGFASGGQVKDREGMFTTPGMNGAGAIKGAANLLSFATQTPVALNRDTITSSGAFLDAESGRMTMFGRRNNPQFQKVQDAKRQAFDLYASEMNARQQAKEQEKANKKALIDGLKSAAISAGVGALIKTMGAGFKAGFSGTEGSFGAKLGAGLKGTIFGGNEFGGETFGGLKNLFSNRRFDSGIPQATPVTSIPQATPFTPKSSSARTTIIRSGGMDRDMGDLFSEDGDIRGSYPMLPLLRATGGLIPAAGGVDTVPAMLSGGEFVMNAAATRNIGAGNLQALNSGAGVDNTDLVSKLDELILATEASQSTGEINITVNGSNGTDTQTSGQDATDQQRQLSERIKVAVKQVIADEQRLGGQLRR